MIDCTTPFFCRNRRERKLLRCLSSEKKSTKMHATRTARRECTTRHSATGKYSAFCLLNEEIVSATRAAVNLRRMLKDDQYDLGKTALMRKYMCSSRPVALAAYCLTRMPRRTQNCALCAWQNQKFGFLRKGSGRLSSSSFSCCLR